MHRSLRAALLVLAMATSGSLIAAQAAEPVTPGFAEQSTNTAAIGQRYLKAYMDKDWDSLEAMLSEDAIFEDPTATAVFGTVVHHGKAAVMKNFRENYAPITLRFVPIREMAAADHAFFIGDLHWTYQLPQREIIVDKMPMVIELKVVGGRVQSHRDYADYRAFIDAENASRTSKGKVG